MKVSSLLMNWCLLTEPFISKGSQKEFFLNTFSSNKETIGKLKFGDVVRFNTKFLMPNLLKQCMEYTATK